MLDAMYRRTASLLLTLMLVGVLAPVALAISAPPLHACCARKPLHHRGLSAAELRPVSNHCQHDCCHALAGLRAVSLKPLNHGVNCVSHRLPPPENSPARADLNYSSRFVRGPPQVSIA